MRIINVIFDKPLLLVEKKGQLDKVERILDRGRGTPGRLYESLCLREDVSIAIIQETTYQMYGEIRENYHLALIIGTTEDNHQAFVAAIPKFDLTESHLESIERLLRTSRGNAREIIQNHHVNLVDMMLKAKSKSLGKVLTDFCASDCRTRKDSLDIVAYVCKYSDLDKESYEKIYTISEIKRRDNQDFTQRVRELARHQLNPDIRRAQYNNLLRDIIGAPNRTLERGLRRLVRLIRGRGRGGR